MPPAYAGRFASTTVGRGRYLRPTAVQEHVHVGQNVGLEIIGLRSAARIPEDLRAAYEKMLVRLERALEDAARRVVPGGPEGTLARQVRARRLAHDRVVIGTLGSKFARALDRGFTSTAKTGKALRFEQDGQVFYRQRVRVAGRHFYAEWIVLTPPIVERVYAASFFNIKRSV